MCCCWCSLSLQLPLSILDYLVEQPQCPGVPCSLVLVLPELTKSASLDSYTGKKMIVLVRGRGREVYLEKRCNLSKPVYMFVNLCIFHKVFEATSKILENYITLHLKIWVNILILIH